MSVVSAEDSESDGDVNVCALCSYDRSIEPYLLHEDWEACYKCSKCPRYVCQHCRNEPWGDEYDIIICNICMNRNEQ